ncbi:hypothetical protein GCM10027578_13940 [Spirosoma luteolum]
MQFIVQVPDHKASFFLELARSLKFKVQPAEVDAVEPTREQLKDELRQAVKEVKLAQQGKLQLPTLDEFLNGL